MGLIGYQIVFMNSVGNPILYTLTNRRFSRFVKQMFRMRLAEFTSGVAIATGDSSNQKQNSGTDQSSTVHGGNIQLRKVNSSQ